MRPQTPTLQGLQTTQAGPTSPPDTPTAGSPTFQRRAGPNGGRRLSKSSIMRQGLRRPSLTPLGGVGTQFAYHRSGVRPAEISPRSSSSSEDEDEWEDEDDDEADDDGEDDDKNNQNGDSEEDEEDEEDDDDDDDDQDNDDGLDPKTSVASSPLSDIPEFQPRVAHVITTLHIITTEANFSIEPMSDGEYDAMESDFDATRVLRPSGYEYPESDRSRSRPRPIHEVDPEVMRDFQGLNCIDSSEESEDWDSNEDESEMAAALRMHRMQRRHRRMTSGSISKRTVSDRGSDSDREDLQPWDHGEVGPNPRRIRRKTERFSWISSATTQDIIYELKEPDDPEASVDESGTLARELPYYLYMDVDSE